MSFTPYVALTSAVPVLYAAARRRPGAAIVASAGAAVLAGTVLPRAIRKPQPTATGEEIRILTANMLVGRASPATLVDLIRSSDADVVCLQEVTTDAVRDLKEAGVTELLGYELIDVIDSGPDGSAIYSRFPLRPGTELAQTSMAMPTAIISLPSGAEAEVISVHPKPPIPPLNRNHTARWRNELSVLPAATGRGRVRILAGDFNATLDHAQLGRLLRKGYADAADQAGAALVPTWGPRRALLTLDHVLVDRRCAVDQVTVHQLPGSDHRAVVARIRLPEPDQSQD